MRRIMQSCLVFAAAAALGACSLVPEGPLFDTEKAAAEAAAKLPPKVAARSIERIELGRLHDGYMLTAFAVAPGAGYYQPELRPRNAGAPAADGVYEFDFFVRPPQDTALAAAADHTGRLVRGDFELTTALLRAARGVRVYSGSDSVEGLF